MAALPTFEEWKKNKAASEEKKYRAYEDSFRAFKAGDKEAAFSALRGTPYSDADYNGWQTWHVQNEPRLDVEYAFKAYDPSLVGAVGKKFKSTWGDATYYNVDDPEDYQRMLGGQMPKHLEKKYKLDDPFDRYLYDQGLPWRSEFSDMYSELYKKGNEITAGMVDSHNAYTDSYASLLSELSEALNTQRGQGKVGGAIDKNYDPSDTIAALLTSGRYDDLAGYYREPKEQDDDADPIAAYAKSLQAPDFSLYDAAYEAIQRGESPSGEFFDQFKESDYKKWLAQKQGFSFDDLMRDVSGAPEDANIDALTQILTGNVTAEEIVEDPELWQIYATLFGLETEDDEEAVAWFDPAAALKEQVRAVGSSQIRSDYEAVQKQIDDLDSQIAKLYMADPEEAPARGQYANPRFGSLGSGEQAGGGWEGNPRFKNRPGDKERNAAHAELESRRAVLRAELQRQGQLLDVADSLDAQERLESLADVKDSKDFEEKSQYSKAVAKTLKGDVRNFYDNLSESLLTKTYNVLARGDKRLEMPALYAADEYLTDDEKAAFMYIAATQGQEGAQAYYDVLVPALYARDRESIAKLAESMTDTTWGKIGSSAMTVAGQLMNAREGVSSMVRGGLGTLAGKETLVRNDPGRGWTALSGDIRANTASDIQASAGDLASVAYQLGMSMADSAVRIPLGKPGLALAGLSAASSTVDAAVQDGASTKQAFALGAVAGGIEVATEKMALDNFFKVKNLPQGQLRAILLNALKQSGVEASEEAISEVVNIAMDVLHRADDGEWAQSVATYMNGGMSYEQAQSKTITDMTLRVGGAALGGAVSGIFFGFGANVVGTYQVGRAAGGNVLNAGGAGRKTISAYEQAVKDGKTLGSGVQLKIAEDINALGLDRGDADAILYVADQFSRQPESWVTPATAQIYAAFAKTLGDNAARAHTWTAQREAQATKARTRLTTLYTRMQEAYDLTDAALQAGDLRAHARALETVNAAMRAYQDAYTNAEADATAQDAAHAQKMKGAQEAVVTAAAKLEAAIPGEVEYQRQLAAEIEGQAEASETPTAAAQTAPNMSNVAAARVVPPAGAPAPAPSQAATREESESLPMTDARNVARYQQEITAVLDGAMPSWQTVLVGQPSDILAEYMKSNNPLHIGQKAVRKVAMKSGKHGQLGVGVLYELPYQLANPMAITGNTTKHVEAGDRSVIVWTDWKTESGDSVIIPIRIDISDNGKVYNNINTVFDAYNPAYVADLLREGNVLYTRNGKSIEELLSQRRQVPKSRSSDAFTNNIPEAGKKSNRFAENSQSSEATPRNAEDYFFDPDGELTGAPAPATMEAQPNVNTIEAMLGMEGESDGRERAGAGDHNRQLSEVQTGGRQTDNGSGTTGEFSAVSGDPSAQGQGAGARAGDDGAGPGGHGGQSGQQARVRLSESWDAPQQRAIHAIIERLNAEIFAVNAYGANMTPFEQDELQPVAALDADTMEILTDLAAFCGREVCLYTSKSGRTDLPGGFTDGKTAYIQAADVLAVAFHYGHEVAEMDASLREAAYAALERCDEGLLDRYIAVRRGDIQEKTREQLKKEFACDLFGCQMQAAFIDNSYFEDLGVDASDSVRISDAFEEALYGHTYEETDIDDETAKNIEASMPGMELSENRPTEEAALSKARIDGINGERAAEFAEKFDNRQYKKTLIYQEALGLYKEGYTPYTYWQSNPKQFDKRVARQLLGIRQRNGHASGGQLAESDLNELTKNALRFPQFAQARFTASAPYRIMEDLGQTRRENTNEARIKNYEDGQRLRDAIVGFADSMNGESALYMIEARKKVQEAYGKGTKRESALIDMLGQKYITDAEAADAVYDGQHMIVEHKGQYAHEQGIFVFGKSSLSLISDMGHTVIFDQKYRDAVRHESQELRKALMASRSPADAARIVERFQMRVKNLPRMTIKGSCTKTTIGNVTEVRLPDGTLFARVEDGEHADMDIVRNTSEALRQYYNGSYRDMNRTMLENGYPAIGFIEDYMPHHMPETGTLKGLTRFLTSENLPTWISGQTAGRKPGRPYNEHVLERLGTYTNFDAIDNFNDYLPSAADLIYMTPVIQRIRQFERALREISRDESAKGNGEARGKNAALVAYLAEYGNQFANKKPMIDRGAESFLGRKVYVIQDKLTGMFGASAVAGNVSVALSNRIAYYEAIPTLGKKELMQGTWRAFEQGVRMLGDKASFLPDGHYDGFGDDIPFLASRRNAFQAILAKEEHWKRIKRGSSVLGSALFDVIDYMSTESVARAYYDMERKRGATHEEACRETSAYCTKLFANRVTGMTPLLFKSRVAKPFTQFLLEPVNQIGHLRDIKWESRKDAIIQINELIEKSGHAEELDDAVGEVLQKSGWKSFGRALGYIICLWLVNLLPRFLKGQDQTLNPIGLAIDFARDAKEDGAEKALKKAGKTLVQQSPVGGFVGGGRIPVGGALDDVKDVWQTWGDDEVPLGQKIKKGGRAALSFVGGGGQISKTWRGIEAGTKGGYYTDDGRLRYPIEEDDTWKAILFGPSAAAPRGYDWTDKPLPRDRTESYQELTGMGYDPMEVFYMLAGYNGSTNATKALSILTADADGDGKPDFTGKDVDVIAEVLGLSYEPKPDYSLEDWAQDWTEDYRNKTDKLLEDGEELGETRQKNQAAIDEFWEIMAGMK